MEKKIQVDIYPEKAQYLQGETVRITVGANACESEKAAFLKVYHLECLIKDIPTTLRNGSESILLGTFEDSFAGFGVVLEDKKTGKIIAETAFDVVDDHEKAIRYGFLSDFDVKDGDEKEDISFLLKNHINMVQFYDWSYRHDCLVSNDNVYVDMMGKTKDMTVIKGKIDALHKYGMKALAYGAVYAASKEYYEAHKDQAFYTSVKEPIRFIDIFYIMNIAKQNKWHDHIISEYRKAVEICGFDGIHMDTYGFPKDAFDADGKKVWLEECFPMLIEDAKTQINLCKEENYLIFNHVGNWPVGETARTSQSAVYIEVWPPYERYHHIREIIREAKSACDYKKPVILAAYLAPFRLETQDRAESAALILTAAITSLGAYHLWLGEEGCALTQGYYPDYTKLQDEFLKKLRRYQDFSIQYMNLFHNKQMIDVSMTHIGGDNFEYSCDFDYSGDGEADKIWMTIKQNNREKCLSLINLSGCDDFWNKGKNKPIPQKGLHITIQVENNESKVYWASPDANDNRLYTVPFEEKITNRGRFIDVEVPELEYWGILYIV